LQKPGTVAHAYNPSYLGASDLEDHSSRPAQANSSRDPISKITRAKWAGGAAQVVELLLCQVLSSNAGPTKNNTIELNDIKDKRTVGNGQKLIL
jgi:hypothetical protein